VTGALAAFLAVGILPWVTTADSDSRTWYGFFDVMSYSDPNTMELAGWVIGIVVCVAIATVVLVLVASLTRVMATGSRIAAVIGAVLVSVLGIAAAHAFTDGDEALHTSAGPWVLALGSVLMSIVLLKPSIGSPKGETR